MAYMKINGKSYPAPAEDITFTITPSVEYKTNANGKAIGQKTGRDKYTFDNLKWNQLDPETWTEILEEFDSGSFTTIEFWHMESNQWMSLSVYAGERSATVHRAYENGKPHCYLDCTLEINDSGW